MGTDRLYGLSGDVCRVGPSEKLPVTLGFWSSSVYPQALQPVGAALLGAGWLPDKGPQESSRCSDSASPKEASATGHPRNTSSGTKQQAHPSPPSTVARAQTTAPAPGATAPAAGSVRDKCSDPTPACLAPTALGTHSSLAPAQPTSSTSSSHVLPPGSGRGGQRPSDAPGPNPATAAMPPQSLKPTLTKPQHQRQPHPALGVHVGDSLPLGGQGGIQEH